LILDATASIHVNRNAAVESRCELGLKPAPATVKNQAMESIAMTATSLRAELNALRLPDLQRR
jgi:hypothetical protein